MSAPTRREIRATAYVLAATSVMPLYGKLSDQYGRLILFRVKDNLPARTVIMEGRGD
jgi:hypothetical protein